MGSGSVFCCASSATCSTLTSVVLILGKGKEGSSGLLSQILLEADNDNRSYVPFPVCASATNASATKNSSFDTRGRVLTRLTIFEIVKHPVKMNDDNQNIDRSVRGWVGIGRKTEENESMRMSSGRVRVRVYDAPYPPSRRATKTSTRRAITS